MINKTNKEIQTERMMTYYIEAANKIIDTEGIENITLRKISDIAGYNTATMYNYFDDLDHLILFACMKYLKDYTAGLMNLYKKDNTSYELYIGMWEVFSNVSFRKPEIFYRLFFGKHSENINNSIKKYYEIFPDELGKHSYEILKILQEGLFIERNSFALGLLVSAKNINQEKIEILNEIIIYLYQSLLLEKINNMDIKATELEIKMMGYIEYLLALNKINK